MYDARIKIYGTQMEAERAFAELVSKAEKEGYRKVDLLGDETYQYLSKPFNGREDQMILIKREDETTVSYWKDTSSHMGFY